jgi:hypothetical protein
MSLPESENRNPYVTTALVSIRRGEGRSHEEIAKELRFDSVEQMRALLDDWKLPDWLIGTETKPDKKRSREKSTPPACEVLVRGKTYRPLVMLRSFSENGLKRYSKTPNYLNT